MTSRLAFLYPGQSQQRVGMGRDLFQHHPAMRQFFDAADSALGFKLSRICFEGPEDLLNQDLNSQLAIYVHACAVTEILKDAGVMPDLLTGYSSGFYGAAYGAGCYDFLDGLKVVKQAGELLLEQAARFQGAMGVIFGLSVREVQALCRSQGDVQVAIFNTPRQLIVSGRKDRVQGVVESAMEKDALDGYLLPAVTAYHSGFMKPAGDALLEAMDTGKLRTPRKPLISYSTLEPVHDGDHLAQVLASQLSGPVKWVELVGRLRQSGVGKALEVGPGKVLSRAVRWIDRTLEVLPTDDAASLRSALDLI